MLTWHALAKLRMHHDLTLRLLRDATVKLGQQLRNFQKNVCPHYETLDSQSEADARARASARTKKGVGKTANSGQRKVHQFNIATTKIHSLGDFEEEIVQNGTTDGFSTQLVYFLDLSCL